MATATGLDRQWAFDTALAGLRAQGCRSLSPNGVTCLYRGQDGLKCAVGFLIPDERYVQSLDEGNSAGAADQWNVQEAVCPDGMSLSDGEFLYQLQRQLHDGLDSKPPSFGEALEAAAVKFAGEFGLAYTAPAEQVSA